MKKFLQFLVFAALAVGYFLWPSYTMGKFTAAIDRGDQAAAKELMDFDALRQSLVDERGRPEFAAALKQYGYGHTMQEDYERNQARGALGPNPRAQDTLRVAVPDETVMLAVFPRGKAIWENGKWEGLFTYSVTNKTSGMKYLFRMGATGWKLRGVVLGTGQMYEMTRIL